MPTLIAYGLRGELPPLVNPDVARDYIYIEDVLDAYMLAASQPEPEPGAIYNIGTGRQLLMRDVVEIARQTLGIKAEPQWGTMANRVWDTATWIADNRFAQEKLGWCPQYSFEQGLRLMIEWSRSRV